MHILLSCVSGNCALYSAFILIIFILVNMITVSCTFSLELPLKKKSHYLSSYISFYKQIFPY